MAEDMTKALSVLAENMLFNFCLDVVNTGSIELPRGA